VTASFELKRMRQTCRHVPLELALERLSRLFHLLKKYLLPFGVFRQALNRYSSSIDRTDRESNAEEE
jgi:hypothetical protein